MANQQLLDYIRQQLLQGVSKETISAALLTQGWKQEDVNEAFVQVAGQNTAMPAAQVNTAQISANNAGTGIGDATKNGKATAGLVLGIIGIVTSVIAIIGAAVSIVGLVFSIKGLKSLKRGMAITGIVLSSIGLLVSIGSGVIGAYQGANGQNWFVNTFINKNTKTLDEKAYSNDKYGFKINPPKGWLVDDSGRLGIVKFSNPKPDQEGVNSVPASISISIEFAQGLDLDAYVSASKETLKKVPDYKPINDLPITLYGIPARIIESSGMLGGVHARMMQLIIIKDRQAYIVTAGAVESASDQYQNLFHSSLLTFSFN